MFNAHQLTSSRALEMLESGEMSDCVIEVQEQQNGCQDKKTKFNVHKLVLSVNSDVFCAMFSHKNTKECQESRIVIEDSTGTAVRQMLIYMYTGERPEEYAIETDAVPLLHIANKYHIESLVQLIEQGLVKSLSLEIVFDRLQIADLYQLKSLHSACGQLIRRNLKMVRKDAKWLELKKTLPELAFSILEDVDEFGNSNIFKTASNKMSTNQFNIKSRALEMFQSGQGADCLIEVVPQSDGQEKQEFNVHKFVLMVNSDVFRAMFSHENTKEARESRIQINDSTGTAVRQMLIYMYTGELPKEYARETDTFPLMHIANKYQIKPLVQSIELGLINSLSLGNVLDRLEMADLYQMKELYSFCGPLIRRNLKMLSNNAKWLELKKKSPELASLFNYDDDDEKEEIEGITSSHSLSAAPAATNNYQPTLKNELSWFLILLVSYLAMCIPINGVVLVLVGWRNFFYGIMWMWSFPGFLPTIIMGHIHLFLERPSWRRCTYFCPNFPLRLCVYWAITALLSFLIIAFVLGRHFLLGDPPQLTTSPEAIFPPILKLDCSNPADNDANAKVPSNQTVAADEVVARFSEVLGDDDEAKRKMHKCIKEILDDALGDDKAVKRNSKCEVVFLLLLIFGPFIVGIVEFCFIIVIDKMPAN